MNLKVGDILLCKQDDNCWVIDLLDYQHVYKNRDYIINDIKNENLSINNLTYFYDKTDNWYVWDYFYTPQEVRKLKLKQLNKC